MITDEERLIRHRLIDELRVDEFYRAQYVYFSLMNKRITGQEKDIESFIFILIDKANDLLPHFFQLSEKLMKHGVYWAAANYLREVNSLYYSKFIVNNPAYN